MRPWALATGFGQPLECMEPFTWPVTEIINKNAICMKLPPHLKAHDVINAQYLKAHVMNPFPDRQLPPPPPANIKTNEYFIDVILTHRPKPHSCHEYLVHWDGYSHDDDTWEPEDHLSPESIRDYWVTQKAPTPPPVTCT
ncbi:hypothetical protein I311_05446 [Cryptococcus gattii NT-10]|nr:hypothetical protein I311_05446 [Cryptococcus gattii NT-10]